MIVVNTPYGTLQFPDETTDEVVTKTARSFIEKAKVAEDLPDVPQDSLAFDNYIRAQAEKDHEIAKQQRSAAARDLEAAEDGAAENALEFAGKAAATTNQAALSIADFLTAYPRFAGNTISQGLGGGRIESIMDLLPASMDPRNVQGPEEESLNLAAQGLGMAPLAAAMVVPRVVQGVPTVADLAMELAGVGSMETKGFATTSKEAQKLYQEARYNLDKRIDTAPSKTPNAAREDITNTYDFSTDEGVAQAANDIATELQLSANSNNIPVWQENSDLVSPLWKRIQKIDAKIAEREAAGQAATPKQLKAKEDLMAKVDELGEATPQLDTNPRLLSVFNELEARFGLNRVEAAKQIARQGGLRPAEGYAELLEREAAMARNTKAYDGDGDVAGFMERLIRPVSEVVASRVGQLTGRKLESAFETAARNQELRMMHYLSDAKVSDEVRNWADTDEVKRMFLDLSYVDPETGVGLTASEAKSLIRSMSGSLSREGRAMVNQLIKDTEAHQREAARLYREDVKRDGLYWASSKKAGEKTAANEIRAMSSEADINVPKGMEGTQKRSRKSAYQMTDEELATYESPFVAQLQRMTEEESLIQLSKQFNLRPSMKVGDDTKAFFDTLENKFMRESGNSNKALQGRTLIEETYRGSRKRPPKAVELFMKQAYAGTLGQFDSAVLNLHDISVSMLTNGVRPTMKALMERGFDPRKYGIANNPKSLGEFKEGFDTVMSRGKFEKGLDIYTNKAFTFSGFRDMDRFGKGTVLKAAWQKAQDSAKRGTLMDDFGYMMEPKELAQINQVLRKSTKLEDMTPKQRELVTQLMFSRLGEQQLISAAGRPLAYLKNPQFRFMYAMTGFAIKQAEMMKKGMLDNVKKGDYTAAGQFFARYMMTAGLGYGIINQVRGSIQAAMGDEDKTPSLGGFVGDTLSQPLSAVTFNRLGSSYQANEMQRDPAKYLLTSVVPPTGLIGNIAKDISNLLFKGEVPLEWLRSFPGGDELKALLDNEE